ncbi:MAG: hypothetical protein NC343_07855, partial [Muribaculum sp.]|nr:hypothetical protein [Muribaculaceae bacterium]MCM1081650.1 hypothetical protein [Muribaculum sp.]
MQFFAVLPHENPKRFTEVLIATTCEFFLIWVLRAHIIKFQGRWGRWGRWFGGIFGLQAQEH